MAVATSIASFLLYDFFFVQPLYTFSIAAPEEWLDLLLFLVVAIAIGRLSALQLQRRREAELRSAEARAMFAMSRDIATAATALEAAPLLAARLAREAEMARVWIGLGASIREERVVADTLPASCVRRGLALDAPFGLGGGPAQLGQGARDGRRPSGRQRRAARAAPPAPATTGR